MKKIILVLVLLVSSIWAQSQSLKVLVTTPEKESLALSLLEKQGGPFCLTIMNQNEKNAFQNYLAKEVQRGQFKSLPNFIGPLSTDLVCYGYYGNQYNWNNWNWGNTMYQQPYHSYGWNYGLGNNYNGWGTSWGQWGQNYYNNSRPFGGSGIGFGLYFGFF